MTRVVTSYSKFKKVDQIHHLRDEVRGVEEKKDGCRDERGRE